jgi:hypothetical protein
MTVTTIYPDTEAESSPTTMDAMVRRTGDDVAWDTIHGNSTATLSRSGNAGEGVRIQASGTSNQWQTIVRCLFGFDASGGGGGGADVPTTDVVSDIKLKIVCRSKTDEIGSQSIGIDLASPASNTSVADGDYDGFSGVPQATSIALSSVTADSSTYTVFTMNSTGISNFSKSGVTFYGLRIDADLTDTEPSGFGTSEVTDFSPAMVDTGLGADKRPKLEVTHAPGFTPRAIIF